MAEMERFLNSNVQTNRILRYKQDITILTEKSWRSMDNDANNFVIWCF